MPEGKWAQSMPVYHFNLHDEHGTLPDRDGTELADEIAAQAHACAVVHELMRNREVKARSWRLNVRHEDGTACFDLLFASVDESIAHLPPELRLSFETLCLKRSSLSDAISDLRLTMRQVQGTMARADGAPYVASVNGVAV